MTTLRLREALALAVIKLGLGLNQGVSACEVCALHYTLCPPESPPPPALVIGVHSPSIPVGCLVATGTQFGFSQTWVQILILPLTI